MVGLWIPVGGCQVSRCLLAAVCFFRVTRTSNTKHLGIRATQADGMSPGMAPIIHFWHTKTYLGWGPEASPKFRPKFSPEFSPKFRSKRETETGFQENVNFRPKIIPEWDGSHISG